MSIILKDGTEQKAVGKKTTRIYTKKVLIIIISVRWIYR